MANNDAVLKIGAELASTTKSAFAAISKGFKDVAVGMRANADALRAMGKEANANALDKAATNIDKASLSLNKQAKSLTSVTKGYKELNKDAGKTVSTTAKLSTSTDKLASSSDKAAKSITGVAAANRRATEEEKKRIPIADTLSAVYDRLAKSMRTYLSYTVVSSVVNSVRNSMQAGIGTIVEYDQALKDLQAITQATGDEIDQFGDKIQDVASTTKFSVTEVAQGLKVLGQAGFTATESLNTIQSVADLATGTMTDMKSVVDLVTTSLRSFQIDASESAHVVDVLANAVNGSKLTVDKLRVSMNYIGPVAKLAGVSFEDLTSTMMILSNAGIRASTSATGLRQVFAKILTPTKEFSQAVKAAGITMEDLNPRTNKMSTVIANLGLVVQDADDAFRLFGMRGSAAVAALANAGSGEFDKMRALVDRTGIAAKMAATQMEGLQVSIKNLSDKAGVLATKLGEAGVAAAFKFLVDIARSLVDGLIWLVDSGFAPLVFYIGLTVTAITSLSVAMTGLQSTFAIRGIVAFATSLAGLTGATTIAATATTTLAAAVGELGAASLALLTNPVVLAGAAVAALVAVMYRQHTAMDRSIDRYSKQSEELGKVTDDLSNYEDSLERIKKGLENTERGTSEYLDLQRDHKAVINDLIVKYPELSEKLRNNATDIEAQTEAVKNLNKERSRQRGFVDETLIEVQSKKIKKLEDGLVSLAEMGEQMTGIDILDALSFGKTKEGIAIQIQEIQSELDTLIESTVQLVESRGGEIPEGLHKAVLSGLAANKKSLSLNFYDSVVGPFNDSVAKFGTDIEATLANLKGIDETAGTSIFGGVVDDIAGSKDALTDMKADLGSLQDQAEYAYERFLLSGDKATFAEKINDLQIQLKELNSEIQQGGEARLLQKAVQTAKTYSGELETLAEREAELTAKAEESAQVLNDLRERGVGEDDAAVQAALDAEKAAYGELANFLSNKQQQIQRFVENAQAVMTSTESLDDMVSNYNDAVDEITKAAAIKEAELKFLSGKTEQAQIDLSRKLLDNKVQEAQAVVDTTRAAIKELDASSDAGPADARTKQQEEVYKKLEDAEVKLAQVQLARKDGNIKADEQQYDLFLKRSNDQIRQREIQAAEEKQIIEKSVAQQTLSETQAAALRLDIEKKLLEDKLKAQEDSLKRADQLDISEDKRVKATEAIAATKQALLDLDVEAVNQAQELIETNRELALSYAEITADANIFAAEDVFDKSKASASDYIEQLKYIRNEQRKVLVAKLAMAQEELAAISTTVTAGDPLRVEAEQNVQAAETAIGTADKQTADILLAEKVKLLNDEKIANDLTAQEINDIWTEAAEQRLITEEQKNEEIAISNGNMLDQLAAGWQSAVAETESWGEITVEMAKEAHAAFADGLTTAIDDFVSGTKSAKEAFKDFAKDFLTRIAKMILQALVLKAIQGVTGLALADGGEVTEGKATGGPIRGYSTGGKIQGYSPTPTSDNVDIKATAGEYMQPVKAVRHYGLGFMEAIRTLKIPKGIIESFSGSLNMSAANRPSYALAEGGEVPAALRPQPEPVFNAGDTNLNVVNVVDQNLMSDYLDTVQGEKTIINFITKNQSTLRGVLG